MSKEAALRAMREARYANRSAASAAAPNRLKVVKPGAQLPVAAPVVNTSDEALCGHRSMNGRTCTREHGHAAKSHRYG